MAPNWLDRMENLQNIVRIESIKSCPENRRTGIEGFPCFRDKKFLTVKSLVFYT